LRLQTILEDFTMSTITKRNHLTDEERMQIDTWLRGGASINTIAEALGRNRSTISREIRSRALESNKAAYGRSTNSCILRKDCIKRHLCEDKHDCDRKCSNCKLCNSVCPDFEEEVCLRLYEPPYVCNGCKDERKCTLRKRFYHHRKAHEAYREKLAESRSGANISEDELRTLDEFVSPLLLNGQSPHHIVSNNPDQFNVSGKTIYRYVKGNLLSAHTLDLPRVCRLKPRKSKPVQHKVDSACRIGRTYPEFMSFVEDNGCSVVEMDSVIGRIGGKVLLTMLFKNCDFMLAFIRERNTSQSVIDCFKVLYTTLGEDCFKSMFPVCLCDNGSEFSNPKALEFDAQGKRRTNIFYCDPYASFQKPNVELNHQFIRRILPKGSSFDDLSQWQIDIFLSHINSYSREKLNNMTPYDMFGYLYGFSVLDKLNQCKIPNNEIILKPSLVKMYPV